MKDKYKEKTIGCEEDMTQDKTNQQFTLEQISEMLNSMESIDHQEILQVVKTVLSQFEEFLKTRPYSVKEANELFEVYLQIRYWSKKIVSLSDKIK